MSFFDEETALKDATGLIEDLRKENMTLRYLLWIRHGCEFKYLYGDDGEMQCSKHGIDFKRLPAESIKECFFANNNMKFQRNTTVLGEENADNA
jgi:hypothetical protein